MKARLLAGIVLGLLLARALYGAVLIDRVVAVVDDEVITWSELYERTEFELSDQTQALPEDKKRQFIREHQSEVLRRMVDELIIMKEADKAGITVRDEEVEEALREIAKRNHLTLGQFQEVLRKRGVSMKFYRQVLKRQILVQRYETLHLKEKIKITDREVEDYLRKRGITPQGGESVVLRQIYVPYSEGAEETIKEAMKALDSGMPFDEVARKYSQGPLARMGGLLGEVKLEELSEPLRKALKGLPQGQYSRPIRTERGIVVLYLEKRLPTYEAYKRQAREELFFQKLQRLRHTYLSQLRKEHYIEIRL